MSYYNFEGYRKEDCELFAAIDLDTLDPIAARAVLTWRAQNVAPVKKESFLKKVLAFFRGL